LDRLTKKCHPLEITTVEHDERWLTEIQLRVAHKLFHVPLEKRKVAGQHVSGYAFGNMLLPKDTELLIVDGPPATIRDGRYNRLAAIELVDLLCPDGGIVIVDDAERPGENYLASLFARELSRRKFQISQSRTNAAKRQEVIAYGSKFSAAFF
jgi:hypothetical protein